MRVGRARHRTGSQFVLQARLEGGSGLVFYWSAGSLLAHSGFEAAPLNHETVDDAVKYRAIVETAVDVLNEIRDRLGSLVGIKLDRKSTRLNSSHLVISYAVFCLKKKHTVQLLVPP